MSIRTHKIGIDANLPVITQGERAGAIAQRLADPQLIAGTGVAWLRLNLVLGPWSGPTDQTPHQGRTWAETYQALIDPYLSQGMQIYGLIGHESVRTGVGDVFRQSREQTPDRNRAEQYLAEYVDNFEEIVKLFQGKINVFESFNEPDDWHGSDRNWIHPSWFAVLLDQVYRRVKIQLGMQNVRLVSGPLQGLELNGNAAVHYLRQTYQYGREHLGWGQDNHPYPFDDVGYHIYLKEGLTGDWASQESAVRHMYREYVDGILGVIQQFEGTGHNKQLYISEIGWHSHNNSPEALAFQVQNMNLALDLLVNDPAIAVAIWFCTEDFDPPAKCYGLYHMDNPSSAGRKPAYHTFKAFCERLNQEAGQPTTWTLPETQSAISTSSALAATASVSITSAPLPDYYPPYIYGLHEAGGQNLMLEANRAGWILEMGTVGHEPQQVQGAANYTNLTNDGLGVIVRLNHGFGTTGTIPLPPLYPAFAQSCAVFVQRSQGCHIWIIGNEPNHAVERPDNQLILPHQYAQAYKLCRRAIRNLADHKNDQVLVAGPALWNNTTPYPENPAGDWVKYFSDTLATLGSDECDGFALHTYTHNYDPTKIRADVNHPTAGYHHLRDEFRSYRDFMEAIPDRFRQLPVFITETDPTERHHGWGHGQNINWVRTAYEEIAEWNSNPANQPILALILYRWPKADDQPEWSIVDRPGVQDDFRSALRAEPPVAYRMRSAAPAAFETPSASSSSAASISETSSISLPTEPPPDENRITQHLTNQQIVTLFSHAGKKIDQNKPWALLSRAGLSLNDLALDQERRSAIYNGPKFDQMTQLTEQERNLIKWELSTLLGPPELNVALNFSFSIAETPGVPTGFLKIRSELINTPLALPKSSQLKPSSATSAAEKRLIRIWNRYGWLLITLADTLQLKLELVLAVLASEVGQRSFADNRPMLIRFENHIFFDKWGQHHPDKFKQHFKVNPNQPWQSHHWRPAKNQAWRNCHGSQSNEWAVFEFAQTVDDMAAKLSTAMGIAQIMGFNYATIGHLSVDQMFRSFAATEHYQVLAFFDLICGPTINSRQLLALQAEDFETFAALHYGARQSARFVNLLPSSIEAFRRLKPAM